MHVRLDGPVLRLCVNATLVFLLGLLAVGGVAIAQTVPPGITALQPMQGLSNNISALRSAPNPMVLVHRPRLAPADVERAEERLTLNVQAWEFLLLGLGIPYRLIESPENARQVPGARILILPGSEVLSPAERSAVESFVRRGGGLIAQGRTGIFSPRGTADGDAFFRTVFGAEHVTDIPPQPTGVFQILDGSHPITAGMPPGYLQNLRPIAPFTVARTVEAQAVGRILPYERPDPDPYIGHTLALYNTLGQGRVYWTRYLTIDVSNDVVQARKFVIANINALAWLTGAPTIALRPWPNGSLSAFSIAVLPVIGTLSALDRGMERLLNAFQQAEVPATFFLDAEVVSDIEPTVRRMASIGELAMSSLDAQVIARLPLQRQTSSISAGVRILRALGPVSGIHPVVGYYDHNTLRAIEDQEFRYLLRFPPHASAVPELLELAEDADFRETLFGRLIDMDTLRVIGEFGLSDPFSTGVVSTDVLNPNARPAAPPPGSTLGPRNTEPTGTQDRFNALEGVQRRRRATNQPPVQTPVERGVPATGSTSTTGSTTTTGTTTGTATGSATATTIVDPRTGNRYIRPGQLLAEATPQDAAAALQAEASRRPAVVPPSMLRTGGYSTSAQSRLLALPVWGRDNYAISGATERAARPDLQFLAFRDDFMNLHESRGLYVMHLHAEIQGASEERAAVIPELVAFARQEGTWISTLEQIREWWLRLDQVGVRFTSQSDQTGVIEVINSGRTTLSGVSLDLFGIPLNANITGSGLRRSSVEPDRVVVIVNSLPPGTTRITVNWTNPTPPPAQR